MENLAQIGDFLKSFNDAIQGRELVTVVAIVVPLLCLLLLIYADTTGKRGSAKINTLEIQKEKEKVVDTIAGGPCTPEIEGLAQFKDGKLVMCRCWRSSSFPYCDGSHNKHNKENNDNVGPLIIKYEEAAGGASKK